MCSALSKAVVLEMIPERSRELDTSWSPDQAAAEPLDDVPTKVYGS